MHYMESKVRVFNLYPKKKRHNKIVKADETVNALTCKSEVRSKFQNTEPLKSHRWVVYWVELYAIHYANPSFDSLFHPPPPPAFSTILSSTTTYILF